MNSFSIISQYVLNDSHAIFLLNDNMTSDIKYEFWKFIFENELHITPDIITRKVKVLFYMYATKYDKYETKNKFVFLKESMENMFCNDETGELLLKVFSKTQSIYHLLSRAAYRYKYKKNKIKVDKDVFLNPIQENQRNTITIMQYGYKYIFTVTDIINILNSCLGNTEFFFASPLIIKNPYNNMPLSKAILYNIYYTIKASNFIMPQMFHAFFMENFNIAEYTLNNENTIREYSIKKFIENTSDDKLSSEIRAMLKTNYYGKRIKIDPEFPKNILAKAFRPYLQLYYLGNYSVDCAKRIIKHDELTDRLNAFYKHNRFFGRKTAAINQTIFTKIPTVTISFNTNFIPFQNTSVPFDKDHISFSSSDSDSDEESDGEEEG